MPAKRGKPPQTEAAQRMQALLRSLEDCQRKVEKIPALMDALDPLITALADEKARAEVEFKWSVAINVLGRLAAIAPEAQQLLKTMQERRQRR